MFTASTLSGGKPEQYAQLIEQARGLLDGERDRIANAANLSALVNQALAQLNWVGFYFYDGTELVVGPFQGLPACVRCHGEALTGVQPGIPSLLGLPRLYIASQLGAWVTGDRRAPAPDCMADVGRKLDNRDITAIAGWLAAQPVPAGAKPATTLPGGLPVACSAMEARW